MVSAVGMAGAFVAALAIPRRLAYSPARHVAAPGGSAGEPALAAE